MEQNQGDRGITVQLDMENDVCMEIGARLRLSIVASEAAAESIFVGHKKNEYLVATLPSGLGSAWDQLSKGDNLNIRYLYKGHLLQFQTRLLDIVSYPVALMMLEFPLIVRSCELRSQKRINCYISAKIEVETNNKGMVTNGVIKDISKTGCRLILLPSEITEGVFQLNEQINLRCHFPGIAGEQEAIGMVMDIQKNDDQITIGIQFSDILWWVPPYA